MTPKLRYYPSTLQYLMQH